MVDKTKPVVPKSMLTRIVKGIFSIENLSPNKLSTMKASAAQTSVTNALKKRGLKGFLLASAVDIAMDMFPEPTKTSQGADPLNLFGPKRKDKVDKAAVEAAVKEANEAMDSASKLAPDQSQRPVTRDKKKKSEDKPLRPVTRKDVDVKNLNMGGMAKAKPRTGNTDYRKGGMFMKNGKK